MKTIYTIDGDYLAMNGERVLFCEGATADEMEATRAKYQEIADTGLDADYAAATKLK